MQKTKPFFTGTIDKGELILDNKDNFLSYLTSLQYKTTPAKVTIRVDRVRKNRSLQQNSYYWVCITHIATEIGETAEDLHSTFKSMYLTDRTKKLPMVRSTTSLNTKEFMDYMEKISIKVSEFGIVLPNPDDMYI